MASIHCTTTVNYSTFQSESIYHMYKLFIHRKLYVFLQEHPDSQVSQTITHTAYLATPNKRPIVLYSPQVAKHHRVIATLCGTAIALRSTVSCRLIKGASYCMSVICMSVICMHVIACVILQECYNHKILWLLLASSLIHTLLPLLLHI